MAKQSGIIKIEGTIDDITFLKKGGKYFIRKKGGVSKSRIKTDSAFQRTRENGAEFGIVANAGKLIRKGASAMVRRAKDGSLNNRLMSILYKVKDFDSVSPRGQRKVSTGITTSGGVATLKGFAFNSKAPLSSVLATPYSLALTTGIITFQNFVPMDMVEYPLGATHVGLRAGILSIDFLEETTLLEISDQDNLPIDMAEHEVTLTPELIGGATGIKMYLLLIEFYQEINGLQYPLKDGSFNSLTLLDLE
jgi:hypothetical protein